MRAAQGRSLSGEFPMHGERTTIASLLLLAAMSAALLVALLAPSRALGAQDADVQLASLTPQPYTAEELDNLLAPVALYPDPILAQVLVAATFPEQVELAAQYLRVNGAAGIDQQPWDISVRALAHYAPVLNLMADRIDWTTALGQAHATQPGDVMEAVQSLRRMARAHGNLVTTQQQEVVLEDRNIYIVPAQPRVIYVPTYDPLVIYHRPVVHVGVYRSGWHFGIAYPIGVWLNYDFDWGRRHVYYHGWHDYRHAHHRHWYHRSRPHIIVNNIYINTRHTTVVINRRVVNRRVHFDRFDRYNTVHRRVSWDRRRQWEDRRHVSRRDGPSWDRGGSRGGTRGDSPGRAAPRRVASGEPRQGSDRPSWDRAGRTGDRAPNASPRRSESGPRVTPRNEPRATPRNAPRATPQNAPRATPRGTPRVTPRVTPRSEPRTTPRTNGGRVDAMRQVARSAPRAEPRRAQPQPVQAQRTSPQRSSVPRTAPQRSSAPRASTPRAAPSRQSAGRGNASRPANQGRAATAKPSSGRRAN